MRTLLILLAVLLVSSACAARPASESSPRELRQYPLQYTFTPRPDQGVIAVRVRIENSELLKSISFRYHKDRHQNFSADGLVKRYKSTVRWEPAQPSDTLTFTAKVNHKRSDDSFDALMTDDWAIFRGDDIVPSARVRSLAGAEAVAQLEFKLPGDWSSAYTGWKSDTNGVFQIDNPQRRFDRPTGWMIAGRLGARRDFLEDGTELVIAAPRGSELERMNALALINAIWSEAKSAFQQLPAKILIVGAGDPMWRGGLSSPNSFYLHEDRPLISENGTSTLLHELTHVMTRVRDYRESDWISEGFAEFYSFELLRRAGAMNSSRFDRVLQSLERWSDDVITLRGNNSSGARTARAVLLVHALDQELRQESAGKLSIDDVTRAMMQRKKVSTEDLENIVEELLGKPAKTLDTPLL